MRFESEHCHLERVLRTTLIILMLALGACNSSAPPATVESNPAELEPGLAARYDSGEIHLQGVEEDIATARTPACTQARNSPGGGSLDDLIPCYREVAEAMAIEGIVLGALANLDQALDELDDGFVERRNATVLEAYYRQLAKDMELGDGEIEAYFEANLERMSTPRQFTLSNIFRRHRDPENPEKTAEFLIGLKARIDAGETFAAIAREYSDSETRLRDGLVGHIAEDKLPQRLRDLAAGLNNDEISEPVMVKGGAVLIMLKNIRPAIQPDLQSQRAGIRRLLVQKMTQERVDERLADLQRAEAAIVFHEQEIIDQLDGLEPDQTIFDLGDQQLSIAEFRRLLGLEENVVAADLPAEHQEQLIANYANLVRRQDLLNVLLESADPADEELIGQVEKPLQEERLISLVDKILQQDMWQAVDDQPLTLERYYRDNNHHYQTPLKFKLQIWNLPFADDPASQLETMEQLREQMERSETTLSKAAEQYGGMVDDLDWRELGELGDLPKKAQSYLLQAAVGGYSVPYQQDDALHMIWVEAQQAPDQLDYETVQEQVREDYFDRFERRLFQDAVTQRLAAAHFVFSTENVRQVLLPPAASEASQ